MPDGKVYLVEGNIKQGEAWGVLLHQFGVHIKRLFGDTSAFQNILRSIERREDEQSTTGKAIREAIKRLPKDTKAEHRSEEILAYMVENNPEVGFVRRVIALIKRALVKMGLSPDIFSAKDFAALADIAVRRSTLRCTKSLYSIFDFFCGV